MIQVCGRCGGTEERPHEDCANCNPWSRVLTCCHLAPVGGGEHRDPATRKVYVSCGQDAAFEIHDESDPRPDVSLTYACKWHVGALLGHADGAPVDASETWTIRALDPSEIGELGPPPVAA